MSRIIQENRHSSPGHFVGTTRRAPQPDVDHTRAFLGLLVLVLAIWALGGVVVS